MTLYHEIVQMRAGATPHTFDGNQTARFNDKAKTLVAMEVSQSMSILTAAEGQGMAVRLQSPNFTGQRYFPAGFLTHSAVETNGAVAGHPAVIVPLDIPIKPNTTMTVDISTVIGATQTGTHDVTIDFIYDDGNTPRDVIDAIRFARNSICPIAVKGGSYNYLQALAVTTETALTGNATAAANIPAEANEIVACISGVALDTAITASEEITGYIRHEFGVPEATDQRTVLNGGYPGLGTEVDNAGPFDWTYNPFYLKVGGREITVRQYANMYGTMTGGGDLAVFLLWR